METAKQGEFWAGGFLYNPQSRKVLLHKRDGNTIYNPNTWAFFGGTNEVGEDPAETFIREFKEETEIDIIPQRVVLLSTHTEKAREIPHYVFFAEVDLLETVILHEGAGYGWFTFDELDSLTMVELVRKDLEDFRKKYEAVC